MNLWLCEDYGEIKRIAKECAKKHKLTRQARRRRYQKQMRQLAKAARECGDTDRAHLYEALANGESGTVDVERALKKKIARYADTVSGGNLRKVTQAEQSYGLAPSDGRSSVRTKEHPEGVPVIQLLRDRHPKRSYGVGGEILPRPDVTAHIQSTLRAAGEIRRRAEALAAGGTDRLSPDSNPVPTPLPLPADHNLSGRPPPPHHAAEQRARQASMARKLTLETLRKTCARIKYSTAAGPDGITPWLFAQCILNSPRDQLGNVMVRIGNRAARGDYSEEGSSAEAIGLLLGLWRNQE